MTNILKKLSLDVHCEQCGEFTVGADIVAESQQLLANGCPGSPHECPAELFASLLKPSVLEAFEGELKGSERQQVWLGKGVRVAVSPNGMRSRERPDTQAVSRWEEDGGHMI